MALACSFVEKKVPCDHLGVRLALLAHAANLRVRARRFPQVRSQLHFMSSGCDRVRLSSRNLAAFSALYQVSLASLFRAVPIGWRRGRCRSQNVFSSAEHSYQLLLYRHWVYGVAGDGPHFGYRKYIFGKVSGCRLVALYGEDQLRTLLDTYADISFCYCHRPQSFLYLEFYGSK